MCEIKRDHEEEGKLARKQPWPSCMFRYTQASLGYMLSLSYCPRPVLLFYGVQPNLVDLVANARVCHKVEA